MVLVRERGAEEGHDAIAHDLVDGALVAMNRLHHAFEYGVEQPARVLGISVGEQLHRPLQVSEEHRDLLALALEGGLRGQGSARRGALGCRPRARRSALPRPPCGRQGGRTLSRTWRSVRDSAPQLAHARARGVAHSSQNLAPGRFSCLHRAHCIASLTSLHPRSPLRAQ